MSLCLSTVGNKNIILAAKELISQSSDDSGPNNIRMLIDLSLKTILL